MNVLIRLSACLTPRVLQSRSTPFQEWEDDEDIPTKHTPSNFTLTSTPTTPAPAQAIDGAITRSRAKNLQQEVNALLCESSINVNDNIILPKCSTLVVLRYTHEEGGDLDRKDWNNRCRTDQFKEGQIGPVRCKTDQLKEKIITFTSEML